MPYFDRSDAYDELPVLPPAYDVETTAVMRACIRASRSLSELQGLIATIPEKRILLELLPLQESESSSAIENIVSSKKRLFMATSGDAESSDRFTREIISYNRALMSAAGKIPDHKTIKTICSIIRGEDVEFRKEGDEPVGLYVPGTKTPVYTPPSGGMVEKLMKNLQEYIFTDDEVDPLIKMAIIHYQFEAIHPFFDGNGRTGRILNVIYLQYSKLLKDPVLFLSGYIIHNKTEYYDLIRRVSSNGEWEPWILFMLDAVDQTSRYTIGLIRSVTELMKDCREVAVDSRIPEKCIDVIFSNPFCTIGMMMNSIGCSKPTAIKYLRTLEDSRILKSSVSGSQKVFENVKLLELFSKGR